MPENLFVACRVGGELVARRVSLERQVQDQIEGVFTQQRLSFFEGVEEEVLFNGRWKPDANELLTLEVTDEAGIFRETLNMNPVAVEVLDLANFADAGIKALFAGDAADDGRILVQQFTAAQILHRKFALFLQGNSFRRLTAPSFALASGLTFVIEGRLIKFKSFSKLRSILEVQEIYREATRPEMERFAGHYRLDVADIDEFLELADQPTRRLISAVLESGTLDDFTVEQIRDAAARTQLEVVLRDGRIVLPDNRRDIKELLRFLDESRYSGPLSGQPFITNSRRPA